jgi:hypothetical protein
MRHQIKNWGRYKWANITEATALSKKELPPDPKYQRRAGQLAQYEAVVKEGGYFLVESTNNGPKCRLYKKDGTRVLEHAPGARLDLANRLLIQKQLDGKWVWRGQ